MAAFASSSTAPATIDLSFLNELYEEIETNPPAIEARKLLIQQLLEAGWTDAAADAIQELIFLDPHDADAQLWAEVHSVFDAKQKNPVESTLPVSSISTKTILPEDLEKAKVDLTQGYEALRSKAQRLLRETQIFQGLAQSKGTTPSSPLDKHLMDLKDLIDGKVNRVVRTRQPESARSVARKMEQDATKAVDIVISDLEDMVRWLRSSTLNPPDNDNIRDALVKRIQTLAATLPDEIQRLAWTALMHVEHEVLHRTYILDETMYGDSVADIPRNRFLVTEDGYPWDMEELSQAITSNGGVMRNPMSRQMFTINDIRAIVQHPFGKELAELQIEQNKLSQGVRPKTVQKLDEMADVLLADMSEDQLESRQTVDAFLAYVATLPDSEQKALDGLRVPARDSHTGMGFDTTIGEAVRDVQGNRLCVHKGADFFKQAASHLRKNG